MQEDITQTEDGAILCPEGDVVAENEPRLRAALRTLAASGVRDVMIDLKNVRMIDSCGLGLLIAAHNSLHKTGGRLSVIHASADLMDLFRMMRMHQHFSISGD